MLTISQQKISSALTLEGKLGALLTVAGEMLVSDGLLSFSANTVQFKFSLILIRGQTALKIPVLKFLIKGEGAEYLPMATKVIALILLM